MSADRLTWKEVSLEATAGMLLLFSLYKLVPKFIGWYVTTVTKADPGLVYTVDSNSESYWKVDFTAKLDDSSVAHLFCRATGQEIESILIGNDRTYRTTTTKAWYDTFDHAKTAVDKHLKGCVIQ